jgi:DNA-binding XRE family transcriptional regulator
MTHSPRPTVDQEAIRHHFHAAVQRRTPAALWSALVDIPVLLTEIGRLTSLLTYARTELANLLAAARATLNAHDEGEPDPLWYLRDEVAAHNPVDGQQSGGSGR